MTNMQIKESKFLLYKNPLGTEKKKRKGKDKIKRVRTLDMFYSNFLTGHEVPVSSFLDDFSLKKKSYFETNKYF